MNSIEWSKEINRRYELYLSSVNKAMELAIEKKDADLVFMLMGALNHYNAEMSGKLQMLMSLLPQPKIRKRVSKPKELSHESLEIHISSSKCSDNTDSSNGKDSDLTATK